VRQPDFISDQFRGQFNSFLTGLKLLGVNLAGAVDDVKVPAWNRSGVNSSVILDNLIKATLPAAFADRFPLLLFHVGHTVLPFL